MAQNTDELHHPHREPMAEGTHSMGTRIAAISGIAAFALGIVILLLQGSVPTLGDSTSAVAKYYSSNANAHRAVVVIPDGRWRRSPYAGHRCRGLRRQLVRSL